MSKFYVDEGVSSKDEESQGIMNPAVSDSQELEMTEDHFEISTYDDIDLEDVADDHRGCAGMASKIEVDSKPSKLRRGFDAVVAKAYSGMSHLGLMQKDPQSEASADHDYFHTTCKAINKHLMHLAKYKHGDDAVFPKTHLVQLKRTMAILDEKEILISFFGQQNCGKSTLLNALLGSTFLPVMRASETSVEVKIQHDSSVHPEVCLGPHKCNIMFDVHRKSLKCPTLYVKKVNRKEPKMYIGPEDIRGKIEKVNKKVRIQKKEPPLLVLKLNIPLLDGNIPQGWTVSLVDNPGFGEANEHIEQMAAVSMKLSAAYIYLMETERMDSQKDKESLHQIAIRDDGAFNDGRLVIGITKFDENYADLYCQKSDGDKIAVTEDSCLAKVQAMMDAIRSENPTKAADFSRVVVIPISGMWAWNSKELEMSLEYDPTGKREKNLKRASKALKYDPNLHTYLTCGEGEKWKTALRRMDEREIIERLNKASGITKLAERIHYMVDKVCVKIWATKLSSDFTRYLEIACMGLTQRIADLEDQVQKQKTDIDVSIPLYKRVLQSRSEIFDTTVKVSDGVHHKKPEESCTTGSPVQTSQHEIGGAGGSVDSHIPDLWEELKDNYHKDLKKSDAQAVGKTHSKGLCAVFKGECEKKIGDKGSRFGPKQFESDMMKFLETSAKDLEKLFDRCWFTMLTETVNQHTKYMNTKYNNLTSVAQKINNKVNVEKAEMPEAGRPRSKTKLNLGDIRTRVSIPSVELRFWEKVASFLRNVGRYIKKRVRPESDQDSDDDDLPYRVWTPEMDDIMGKVQAEMEEVCDKYFFEIKEKTIKYFFDEYCTNTKQLLERFDHEFGSTLQAEKIRLDKLKEEIKKKSKELAELEKMLEKTTDFEQQLSDAYVHGFGELKST